MLRAADAAEMFVAEGIERVMNVFNAASDNTAGRRRRLAPEMTPCHFGGPSVTNGGHRGTEGTEKRLAEWPTSGERRSP